MDMIISVGFLEPDNTRSSGDVMVTSLVNSEMTTLIIKGCQIARLLCSFAIKAKHTKENGRGLKG